VMVDPRERTILVVDDSPPTCLYLRRLLERKGYRVLTANDGASGARMALEQLPDLILLDKEMPGMHGFDVSRILRRHQDTSGVPILMISSETDTAEKIRGLEMGADDFIAKGITGEELYSKIRAFLRIKDLQDKLRRESDKLNQIFRFLHEPVAICSADDRVLLASQVFLNLMRMPREVATFKTMTEILATLQVPPETIETLRRGSREDTRLTIDTDGETVYLTCRTAPIHLDDGEDAVAYIFRDITREVEDERMKADFHSMIAHDLRSPVSVIQGYVALMASGKTGEVNDTQAEFLASVDRKNGDDGSAQRLPGHEQDRRGLRQPEVRRPGARRGHPRGGGRPGAHGRQPVHRPHTGHAQRSGAGLRGPPASDPDHAQRDVQRHQVQPGRGLDQDLGPRP